MKVRHRRIVEALPIFSSAVFLTLTVSHSTTQQVVDRGFEQIEVRTV